MNGNVTALTPASTSTNAAAKQRNKKVEAARKKLRQYQQDRIVKDQQPIVKKNPGNSVEMNSIGLENSFINYKPPNTIDESFEELMKMPVNPTGTERKSSPAPVSSNGPTVSEAELISLRKQLKVNVETIAILVSEKSELESQLRNSQRSAEKKSDEAEELQGRLKASRQRVAELEKQLASSSSNLHSQQRSGVQLTKEVDRLKMDLYKQSKEIERLSSEHTKNLVELQQKNEEYHILAKRLADTEMMYSDVAQQKAESDSLLSRVKESEGNASMIAEENEQLKAQLAELQSAFVRQNDESLELLNRTAASEKAAEVLRAELKTHTESEYKLQKDVEQYAESQSAAVEAANTARQDMEQYMWETKNALNREVEARVKLQDELSASQVRESELDSELEDLHSELDAVNSSLQAMLSIAEPDTDDSQNDSSIESENNTRSSLSRLHTLMRQTVEEKSIFAQQYQSLLTQYQQLQSYYDYVQKQLQTIQQENSQNSAQDTTSTADDDSKPEVKIASSDAQLPARVSDCSEVVASSLSEMSQSIQMVDEDIQTEIDSPGDQSLSLEEASLLRANFHLLEEKFVALAKQHAELQDDRDTFAHRCSQLEYETETIGDYIEMYRQSRAQLHSRELEKDQLIQHLKFQHSVQQEKLSELQDLVYRLVAEKQRAESSQRQHVSPQSNHSHIEAAHDPQPNTSQNSLEWPNYSDSVSSSDESVEQTTQPSAHQQYPRFTDAQSPPPQAPNDSSILQSYDVRPSRDRSSARAALANQSPSHSVRSIDPTTSRIISLMSELNSTSVIEDDALRSSMIHCSCCSDSPLQQV